MKYRDLLIEIGTEELPPKSLLALADAFADGVVGGLDAAGIRHGTMKRYAAPRRLAVLVRQVAEQQPDQEIKRKGPPVSAAFTTDGAPTRAATAFAESCSVPLAALGRITEAKGEFLYHTGLKAGAATDSLLADIVRTSLDKLPIAKRMRWGSGTAEFVRPVHWIVFLYGKDVISADILSVKTGRHTRGHRFMAPRDISISTPSSYASRLEKAGRVLVDFEQRRTFIRDRVITLAESQGGRAIIGEALLDEVTSLVEWPEPICGRFEERFLSLPREVLIATLQDHQRYFPVEDAAGQLTSLFVTVANITSRAPDEVRRGNERVVRPRLADAAFFWDQDRRTSLASRVEHLKSMTFQAQLGSYHARSARIHRLARLLSPMVGADPELAGRAADLAKCDLLTGLVGEFPELQGTMGGYYAQQDGEPVAVSTAIGEQYLPRFAGDALPRTPTGTVLALADKLDTIVGAFAIGQKPTGAKDPFAVRRATLGALRILLEGRLDVDLAHVVGKAYEATAVDLLAHAKPRGEGQKPAAAVATPDVLVKEVCDYAFERLRSVYLEAGTGITSEMFDAVLDRHPSSPVDFDARLTALAEFLTIEGASALTGANKRIANILRKSDLSDALAADAALFEVEAEHVLAAALADVSPAATLAIRQRDYRGALGHLATLRPAVDAFFDGVMVNAENLAVRHNRLALLAEVQRMFLAIADLSRLPG
jgi:glycyl-tRNA synthetase beta chain